MIIPLLFCMCSKIKESSINKKESFYKKLRLGTTISRSTQPSFLDR
jgi:hypothetical protein